MRFLVDDGLPADVVELVRRAGGICHTTAETGLSDAGDAELAVYAAHHGMVLVTMERRLARGELADVAGQVVWVRGGAVEAAATLQRHLIDVVSALTRHDDVVVSVSARSVTLPGPR